MLAHRLQICAATRADYLLVHNVSGCSEGSRKLYRIQSADSQMPLSCAVQAFLNVIHLPLRFPPLSRRRAPGVRLSFPIFFYFINGFTALPQGGVCFLFRCLQSRCTVYMVPDFLPALIRSLQGRIGNHRRLRQCHLIGTEVFKLS